MFWGHLLAIPIALSLCAGVADNIASDYNGEIDMITGEAVTETADGEENGQFVNLPRDNNGNNVIYDMKNAIYKYSCPLCHNTVTSTVANGMITTSKVRITHEKGEVLKLFRNGDEVKDPDLNNIAAPGKYTIVVQGSNIQHQLIGFSIAASKTGSFTQYTLPAGFEYVRITYNDEEQEINDTKKVTFFRDETDKEGKKTTVYLDGDYGLTYRCVATGVRYELDLTIDHTPPEFTVEGVDGSTAGGAVRIVDEDPNDSITVMFNNEKISTPKDGVLSTPGKYTVIVTDDADNSVTKDFEIRFYLNISGWIFVLLVVLFAIAVVVFMKYSKKSLKVR